jgi:hypothetical protein
MFRPNTGTIGEFTTFGTSINASLITGLNVPLLEIAFVTPEPATWGMFATGATGLVAYGWRRRRSRSAY